MVGMVFDGANIAFSFNEDRWIEILSEFIDETIYAGKKPIVILVARKMVRLLEAYMSHPILKKITALRDAHSSDGLSPVFVTEHAIPTYVSNFDKENSDVLIVDDLVVAGRTVNSIATSVYAATGIRPKVAAVAKTKQAEFSLLCQLMDGVETISETDLPKLTTINSIKILKEFKPIDIEYSILSASFERQISDTIFDSLLKEFKKAFDNDKFRVYPIVHNVQSEGVKPRSITILFNDDNERKFNNDFCKLRLYFGKDEVYVEVYAPNIVSEDDLVVDSPLFLNSELMCPWNSICRAANREIKFVPSNEISTNWLLRTYDRRSILTRNIWANYLYSVATASKIVKEVEATLFPLLGESKFTINTQDLCYLVGPAYAQEIRPILEKYLNSEVESNVLRLSAVSRTNTSLIPEEYREEYENSLDEQLEFCNTVQEALSFIFTNLHYGVGLMSCRNEGAITDEQIGETFESIETRIKTYCDNEQESLRAIVHKWIDHRINLGVVVPKYIKTFDVYNRPYWRRFFKAGENEDLYLKIARVVLHEMTDYLKSKGLVEFTIKDMDFIYKKAKQSYERYGSDIFPFCDFDNTNNQILNDGYECFALLVYLSNLGVVDFNIDFNVLHTETKYTLNVNNSLVHKLLEGLPV